MSAGRDGQFTEQNHEGGMPIEEKPSRNEDEYFVKLDAELLKQRRAQLDAERAAREQKVTYMRCPKCGAELKEREYNHVKIDACSGCGGVWLDAGELELVAHQYPGGMAGRLIGMLRGTRR